MRPQKIKTRVEVLKNSTGKKVRIMFQDEAGFGRINTPKYCWCEKGYRPSVPCHHIREFIYAYGAVDPINGDDFFLVLPKCNTICMNLFLQKLSEAYPDDVILLCCDGAAWHKSGTIEVPENIERGCQQFTGLLTKAVMHKNLWESPKEIRCVSLLHLFG